MAWHAGSVWVLVLLWVARNAAGSTGDVSRGYCDCLADCYSDLCGVCDASEQRPGVDALVCPDHCVRGAASGACSRFYRLSPRRCYWNPEADAQVVAWHQRLIGWTCAGECKYKCARSDAKARRKESIPVVQYHGKWPFRRVLGIEELISVLASVGNAIPHLVALWSATSRATYAPLGHPQRESLLVYSLAGVNAWVWSAALHWKETKVTERLDYHSASLLILATAWLAVCRTLGIRSSSGTGLAVASCLACTWLVWIWYMNFVLFDYGLNMLISVAIASVCNVLWLVWAGRQGCCSERHPWAWQAPLAVILLSGLAMLELFDFPPVFFELLDAHALWHISTVPLCFLWYSFLRYDAIIVQGAKRDRRAIRSSPEAAVGKNGEASDAPSSAWDTDGCDGASMHLRASFDEARRRQPHA